MITGRQAPVYLDSAASSQTPRSVIRSVSDYYENCRANVHRGLYPASEQATAAYEAARDRVAELINAEREEVVFTRGTTEGSNLLAQILAADLKSGDEVVSTVLEHHSSLLPWQQLAKRYGFRQRFIGLNQRYQLDMKQAAKLITRRTKVVAVSHISNVTGTVLPIKRLARLAHQVGAKLIVDAAQSAGHRPLDVKALDADFLIFSGHKMFAPTGIGVLYGRRELLEALPPYLYGGDMIKRVSLTEAVWNELPYKYEAGTPNIAGAIGLGEAVRLVQKWTPEAIHQHELQLTEYAIKRLMAIPKVRVFGPALGQDRGGLISFAVADLHPHDLSDILAGEGVAVRGGHHCAMPLMEYLGLPGTTRASFSVYNTREDVSRLIKAIRVAKKIFRV
jgi:cysteine desulfurase/selenocysteine lyase